MQMRPAIQLQSIMKSMKDTVLPAIDPTNKLAVEQGHIILGLLSIMSQRMDLEYRYDRDELARLLRFAELIQRQAQGGGDTRTALLDLKTVVAKGADVLDRARAEPLELVRAVQSLRSRIGVVIQAVFSDGASESKQALHEEVIANAREQLLRERSWLIMQGWEANPAEVPPIESLISEVLS
ncbi:MAG: hypothetical protein RBT11_20175 [Desulfobacterales bacterium]|jgi:hypothetical protein|nr:hypothetical protein [Desulfobacterales bacterium]